MNNKELMEEAEKVLLNNLYEVTLNGINYRRTVPSKEFYVHQWNWDSATHAMGLVYVDEQRAFDELYSLVSGQWENGMIAQITFNPTEKKYFPGPEFWGTEKYAKGEILTSGITQPPLLGVSFSHVYANTKDTELKQKLFIEILPRVIKYHEYLKNYRDPENSGLLTVVHPWESGTDNSPRWDALLKNISLDIVPDEVKVMVNKNRSDDKLGDPKHRPGLEDYYKYMYLVHLYQMWDWDYKKIVKDSPFAVKDVLFNSIWCKANYDLGELLEKLGDNENSSKFLGWADQTKQALKSTWDKKSALYRDIDVACGKHDYVSENTIATFGPMLAGVDTVELGVLLEKLEDSEQYWTPCPIPTTPLNSNKFSLTKYWRGPTWPITNLFVIEGLGKHLDNKKASELSRELIEKTINMIKKNGFYEYFDPTSGVARPDKKETALGFGSFSWTSAISLYLLNKYSDILTS